MKSFLLSLGTFFISFFCFAAWGSPPGLGPNDHYLLFPQVSTNSAVLKPVAITPLLPDWKSCEDWKHVFEAHHDTMVQYYSVLQQMEQLLYQEKSMSAEERRQRWSELNLKKSNLISLLQQDTTAPFFTTPDTRIHWKASLFSLMAPPAETKAPPSWILDRYGWDRIAESDKDTPTVAFFGEEGSIARAAFENNISIEKDRNWIEIDIPLSPIDRCLTHKMNIGYWGPSGEQATLPAVSVRLPLIKWQYHHTPRGDYWLGFYETIAIVFKAYLE